MTGFLRLLVDTDKAGAEGSLHKMDDAMVEAAAYCLVKS